MDKKANQNQVGQKIKEYRKKRGWTQSQLAQACGLNINSIRKYEQERALPKFGTIVKICNALEDCSPQDFFPDSQLNTASDDTECRTCETAQIDGSKFPLEIQMAHPGEQTDCVKSHESLASMYAAFCRLNEAGQIEAAKRINELTFVPIYQDKDYESS